VPTAAESGAEALRKAWARFEERVRRSLRMERPPARRLAEVWDIAESIINALLPDDKDDRRELIGDDYQLESDIETFEELTGRPWSVKRPEHHVSFRLTQVPRSFVPAELLARGGQSRAVGGERQCTEIAARLSDEAFLARRQIPNDQSANLFSVIGISADVDAVTKRSRQAVGPGARHALTRQDQVPAIVREEDQAGGFQRWLRRWQNFFELRRRDVP
jgi:hypothetical protein